MAEVLTRTDSGEEPRSVDLPDLAVTAAISRDLLEKVAQFGRLLKGWPQARSCGGSIVVLPTVRGLDGRPGVPRLHLVLWATLRTLRS